MVIKIGLAEQNKKCKFLVFFFFKKKQHRRPTANISRRTNLQRSRCQKCHSLNLCCLRLLHCGRRREQHLFHVCAPENFLLPFVCLVLVFHQHFQPKRANLEALFSFVPVAPPPSLFSLTYAHHNRRSCRLVGFVYYLRKKRKKRIVCVSSLLRSALVRVDVAV